MNASELSINRLRAAFERGLQIEPEHALGVDRALTGAAVLVAIVQADHGSELLLTRRSPHLQNHGGQISFPGGRIEATDADAIAAALRETEEEIGLARQQVQVLGRLPDYPTVTGFLISPIVGLVPEAPVLRPDPREVDEVFAVPLDFLLDLANYQRHEGSYRGHHGHYWSVPWKDYYIWGATAGILRTLAILLQPVS